MRIGIIPSVVLVLTAAACRTPAEKPSLSISDIFTGEAGRWVDLTYTFSSETVYWPTGEPFRLDEVFHGVSEKGYFYSSYKFSASEHGGTHFDAPVHFAEGRATVEKVPLDRLIGPAVVVDVSARATPDYQVQVSDLESWEKAHGTIPQGSILLLRTGWGSRWGDRKAFLGTDRTGPEAVPELHFPGLSPEAARWLVANRSIDAVGIDTPSIDFGQSQTFETHQVLYGVDIPGFENLANLGELPETGPYVVALPMKIGGGSGAPLRIVAFVPRED